MSVKEYPKQPPKEPAPRFVTLSGGHSTKQDVGMFIKMFVVMGGSIVVVLACVYLSFVLYAMTK